MKKALLIMCILLLANTAVWASPVQGASGVISYSVNYTVYFNNEADAIRWLETQSDFMEHREANAAQRRLMTSVMESLVPNWSDLVRLESDFCVIVARSSNPGESMLILNVRGIITRLWQY